MRCGVVNALIKGEIEMPVGLVPCDERLTTRCACDVSLGRLWLQVTGGDKVHAATSEERR